MENTQLESGYVQGEVGYPSRLATSLSLSLSLSVSVSLPLHLHISLYDIYLPKHTHTHPDFMISIYLYIYTHTLTCEKAHIAGGTAKPRLSPECCSAARNRLVAIEILISQCPSLFTI